MLDDALDLGISEADFWEMSIAELDRAFKSKQRVKRWEAQQKASYDYLLADLIGRSISRMYSKNANYPDISEVYPSLFDGEEAKARKQATQNQLSVLRFKEFANFHNEKIKKEVAKKNE